MEPCLQSERSVSFVFPYMPENTFSGEVAHIKYFFFLSRW